MEAIAAILLDVTDRKLALSELKARARQQVESSKTARLLQLLGEFPDKMVLFTQFRATQEMLHQRLRQAGHDVALFHGGLSRLEKEAAINRFRGPARLLLATESGSEGRNLQFAHAVCNFDLPWNPMDVEQRIGRIHRYGQEHTAQVYNLVSADTIEGQIFLLLEEKLLEIAKTLGKVDELGQIAEDLRGQILGQLSERISYEKLYQDAVRDPKLVRTRQELEVAVENAQTARQVVWELFQDLEGFRLDDYKQMDDGGASMARLRGYVSEFVLQKGGVSRVLGADSFEITGITDAPIRMTPNRELAKADERLDLLGLEHPFVRRLLEDDRRLPASERAFAASGQLVEGHRGLLTIWHVVLQDSDDPFGGMSFRRSR